MGNIHSFLSTVTNGSRNKDKHSRSVLFTSAIGAYQSTNVILRAIHCLLLAAGALNLLLGYWQGTDRPSPLYNVPPRHYG